MSSGTRIIEVISLCCYLTTTDMDWRGIDHTASKMVKAVKGDHINGYFTRSYGRFDNDNKADFVRRVPEAMCAELLREVDGRAAVVPIPNSHVCSVDSEDFKTLEMARDIARLSEGRFVALPLLVFRKPQIKTRTGGGTRDPSLIEAEYIITGQTDLPIILIDDVLTTGGHLIAACRKLEKSVSLPVKAITFGLSLKEQRSNPIARHVTELPIDPVRFF